VGRPRCGHLETIPELRNQAMLFFHGFQPNASLVLRKPSYPRLVRANGPSGNEEKAGDYTGQSLREHIANDLAGLGDVGIIVLAQEGREGAGDLALCDRREVGAFAQGGRIRA